MLGITSQESNMWQASRSAVPGVTGNPLIGNYYGIDLYDGDSSNDWDIDWAEADCGYGITQVTDHMRMAGREDGKGGAAWDYQKQRAVALDYTVNVAAGLQILAEKWNQTSSAGLKVNNGNSAKLENWTFALWAYNSGFYADKGDGSPWGLGWTNNPANPEWDAGRTAFMEDSFGSESPSDAAHPQDWPYQEKVLGFAAHPPSYLESPGTMVAAFIAAWWNGGDGNATIKGAAKQNRALVKPPENLFCDPVENSCNPAYIGDGAKNETGAGPCLRDVDFRCWWHKSAQWKSDCDYSCGNDFTRFPATWAEEADGTAYPPACTTNGLPAGARIVDDVPQGTPVIRPGCSNSSWSNAGTFTLDFGEGDGVHPTAGGTDRWPAKVDLHQLGAGFGGHFYFGHTRKDDDKGQRLKFTGTWKLNAPLTTDDAKVWVHLPDHGAHTKLARYEVKTAEGWVSKTVSQPGTTNRWVDIGVYRFSGGIPEVRLSTITADGTGDQDIAFDAVAFQEGDFSEIPEIRFPDEDLTAPEPEVMEPPEVIPGNFLDLGSITGLSAKSSSPSGENNLRTKATPGCRTVNESKEEVICIGAGPAPEAKKSSKKSSSENISGSAAALNATTGTETVTCSVNEASVSYTRTYACMTGTLILERITSGRPTGQAIWDYRHEIQLDTKSGTFMQTASFKMKSIAGFNSVSLDMEFDCLGACASDPTIWTNSQTWLAGDLHTLVGSKTMKWTGTSGHSMILPSWKFTGKGDGRAGETIDREKSELEIRGDLEAKATSGKPGCVFHRYIPTYVIDSAKNPSAAAFYWIVQQKLPTHPGSRPHKKPLHYNSDSAAATEIREKIICHRTGDGAFLPHPDSGVTTGGRTGPSCDEYPFASSYESGGAPVATGGGGVRGDACLQLYAKKPVVSGDLWTLKEDTRYPRRNTWKEPCGRASLPSDENSNAAWRIGLRLVPENRIIDGDAYWVYAPGFEDCTDLTKVCWVRTR
ncbi:hypothetical protein [Streptomyces sp. NPDC006183]